MTCESIIDYRTHYTACRKCNRMFKVYLSMEKTSNYTFLTCLCGNKLAIKGNVIPECGWEKA